MQLKMHLAPVLADDTLLITYANQTYRSFARQIEISHQYVNLSAGERVRGAIHVQHVNAYRSRLYV